MSEGQAVRFDVGSHSHALHVKSSANLFWTMKVVCDGKGSGDWEGGEGRGRGSHYTGVFCLVYETGRY